MKKITNTNDYSHSVGYQNAEKGKANYTLGAGETITVPAEHESLFQNIEGVTIEDVQHSSPATPPEDTKSDKTKSDIQNKKEKSKVFICPECGVEFGRENVMLEHQNTHPKKEEVKA
jgi:hypothetical protein